MRFLRLRIPAWGQLTDLDSGSGELPGLVVVQGHNESGKSTFFSALQSLIYGIYPVDRDGHPYTPWSGATGHLEADLRLDDGESYSVRRRQLAQPQGAVIREGAEETIRNNDLPFARHITSGVYRQIFALELREMAQLEGKHWESVQDRLFGGMGVRDLRTTREVAGELDTEASALWRERRGGNQPIRDLDAQIGDLTRQRKEAMARDRELRTLHDDLEQARAEREELRRARHSLVARLELLETLAPLRAELHQIQLLESELATAPDVHDLPTDPGEALDQAEALRAQLDARLEEIRDEIAAEELVVQRCVEAHRSLTDRAPEIRAALGRLAGMGDLRRELAATRASLERAEAGLADNCTQVLDRSVDEPFLTSLADFPLGPFSSALQEVEDTRSHRAALPPPPEGRGSTEAPTPAWLPAGTTLAGVVAAAVGVTLGIPLVAAAGVLVVGLGAVLFHLRARAVRAAESAADRYGRQTAAWESDRAARDAAVEAARDKARSILAVLSPGPAAMELRLDLVARMEGLRTRGREVAGLRTQVGEIANRERELSRVLEPFDEFLDELGRAAPVEARAHILEQALDDAADRVQSADAAAAQIARLQREENREVGRLENVTGEAERLRERLGHLGDGDAVQGIQRVRELRRRATHLEELRTGLERRVPDLADQREQIRIAESEGVDWSADSGTLGELRAERERLNEDFTQRSEQVVGAERDLDALMSATTVDDLDGELARTREDLESLIRRRDRYWLLARVVREAERRIRSRHQPAVLATGGGYMKRLTRGRYDGFVQMGDDGRRLGVRGPGLVELAGADPSLELGEPLSTGTREQIYMALRLAMIEELDGGRDRLPLLLDEVMVNWDAERRGAGFELLSQIARSRQIFFFTCHEAMADELEGHGARRIRLEDPSVRPR